MHKLIADFSIPWYIWLGLGVFLCLLVTNAGFRGHIDALLARMLGMAPKKRGKHIEEDEEE